MSDPLHPDCNHIDLMEEHLHRLASGQAIVKPVYNHATGEVDGRQRLEPAPFLIAEGLLGLATPRLREPCHVKVFLDPPEELRERWKIQRDCVLRGYTPEQVRAEIARSRADSVEFIQPQRGWADIVVRFYPNGEGPDGHLNVRLVLRPTLTYPDLGPVLARQIQPRPCGCALAATRAGSPRSSRSTGPSALPRPPRSKKSSGPPSPVSATCALNRSACTSTAASCARATPSAWCNC